MVDDRIRFLSCSSANTGCLRSPNEAGVKGSRAYLMRGFPRCPLSLLPLGVHDCLTMCLLWTATVFRIFFFLVEEECGFFSFLFF